MPAPRSFTLTTAIIFASCALSSTPSCTLFGVASKPCDADTDCRRDVEFCHNGFCVAGVAGEGEGEGSEGEGSEGEGSEGEGEGSEGEGGEGEGGEGEGGEGEGGEGEGGVPTETVCGQQHPIPPFFDATFGARTRV